MSESFDLERELDPVITFVEEMGEVVELLMRRDLWGGWEFPALARGELVAKCA